MALEIDGVFVISQPSSITAYLHVSAHSTQSNVRFGLYSNTGAVVRDSATVNIDAGEVVSIALHHRVTSDEKLTIRVMGTNLDLSIEPESRLEITLLRRWQPPELLVSGSPYPWPSGTYHIGQNIEDYQTIQITGQKGFTFITKNISPKGMLRDTIQPTSKVWIFEVETNLSLTFTGEKHKMLKIESEQGFKILSLYGERG